MYGLEQGKNWRLYQKFTYCYRNQAHEEGVEEGRRLLLIEQVCAKMQKFSSAEEIADDLTIRDVPLIQKIIDVATRFAPDYNVDAIYEALNL